jgi:hypothetical protein
MYRRKWYRLDSDTAEPASPQDTYQHVLDSMDEQATADLEQAIFGTKNG